MAAHYDDPNYSYSAYWQGRDYEHQSEILALNKLLSGRKFKTAADIGGGFGRLVPVIAQFAKKVYLIEPSNKHRAQATRDFKNLRQVIVIPGIAQDTRLPDAGLDLVVIVRVLHHLPDPVPALQEIFRILKPGGLLILEFANSHHFKAQVASWLNGQPILPVPIDMRSPLNIKRKTIPFVNHSPYTIRKLLSKAGFSIVSQLSVSNLRLPSLKHLLPTAIILKLESSLQAPLARFNFGPSIFLLAQKIDNFKNP